MGWKSSKEICFNVRIMLSGVVKMTLIMVLVVLTIQVHSKSSIARWRQMKSRWRRSSPFMWRTRRKLTVDGIKKAEEYREFLKKYIYVKEDDVSTFLHDLTGWGNRTLVERHHIIRKGRLQPVLKQFLFHQTLHNMLLTAINKARQMVGKFNQKSGLDDLIEDVLIAKGVDYDDEENQDDNSDEENDIE